MSTQIRCGTCGYTTTAKTLGLAEYALSRHSCEKRLTAAARHAATVRRYQQTAVEKPCTHKTHHDHGTNARAALDGCKCQPCRDAAYRATKQWRRRVDTHGHANIDATPALEHIKALQAAGLGWKRIAQLAGVANTSVYGLLYGRPNRNGGRPSLKARRETVAKILAVPMPTVDELGSRVTVPSTGTRRRLQALATLGWSMHRLATEAGLHDRQPLDRALHEGTTSAGTARTVRDLYDRLWDTAPTATDRFEQAGITRTRNAATAAGWLPPLAWDNPDTDDAPHLDRPTTTGGKRVHVDDVEFLIAQHPLITAQHLAERLGVDRSTIQMALKRNDRPDLLALLARNAEFAA